MKKPLIVILAGGTGTSFQPLVINKTLVPIAGKPILQHVIESVESAGFHEALIITNPENESWLSGYQPFNITLKTQLVKPTGMGDALLQAEHEIASQPILVINACDIIDPSFLREMASRIHLSYAAITAQERTSYFPGGYVVSSGSKAVDIVEKPGAGNEPSNLFKLVFDYFSEPQDFFSILKKLPTSDDQYETALRLLMKDRHVDIITYTGPWAKLKHSYHVLDVMEVILSRKTTGRARSAAVSSHAVIGGDVYIDEHAIIDAFAVIKGPAYIGRGARVGNHALVRQSVIEAGATVGFGSEVARSYVGPGCALHQNFVGDTVLESEVNPSWGTTFANWKLNQGNIVLKLPDTILETGRNKLGAVVAKGAFLGVNCSVMPGISIGAGAKIYPGLLVKEAVSQEAVLK